MKRRTFIRNLSSAGIVMGSTLPLALTRRTKRFPAPKLDAHAHSMSPAVVDMIAKLSGGRSPVTTRDGAAILAELDRDGIERALVLSTAYLHANDLRPAEGTPSFESEWAAVRADNDYAASEAQKSNGRLLPFAGINPKRPYALEEIARTADQLAIRGLKLHFWNSDVRLCNPEHIAAVRKVFELAADRNLPIVAHIFNGFVRDFGPPDIEILLRDLVDPTPNLRLCVAHLAGAGGSDERVVASLRALVDGVDASPTRRERIMVECSGVFMTEAEGPLKPITPERKPEFAALLRQLGTDRILWGSDNLPHAFRQIEGAWPLDADEWATIAANDGRALWR